MIIEEKTKNLISLSEKQGYITYGEINDAFSDSEFLPEDLEKIYVDLLIAGVQIINQPTDHDSEPQT